MDDKTILINFRVSLDLKNNFDRLCKYRRLSRTHVMISLMEHFIENELSNRNTYLQIPSRSKRRDMVFHEDVFLTDHFSDEDDII